MSKPSPTLLLGAFLAIWAGCSSSDDDPTDPPIVDPPPRAVIAREALTYRGADGTARTLTTDLDTAVVQALVRRPDGSWQVIPGMGTSAGEIVLDRVPAGEGLLRVDYHDTSAEPRVHNEYFVLPAGGDMSIDLGMWQVGRSDWERALTAPTELALDVSGLVPWMTGTDMLVYTAPNLGFTNVFDEDIPDAVAGIPLEGATSSPVRIDWATAVAGPLAVEARGDRAYLMQFRFRQMGGVWVGAPVRSVALGGFTQVDGESTLVAASFVQSTPMRVRVAMDREAFDEWRPDIGLLVGPALGRGWAVLSTPSVVTQEMSSRSPVSELVVLDGDALRAPGPFDLGDIEVVSPFPADSTYVFAASGYPVQVVGPRGPSHPIAEIGVMTNALPTEAAPTAPIVSPVRAITIAGRDANLGPGGVGETPVIEWTAPELGIPSEYEVRILAPGGAEPQFDYAWYAAATIHVPGDRTQLAVPPEIMTKGGTYAIAIRAIAQPLAGDALSMAPRHTALPYGWADAITPSFHP